ncbi:hypothetical protein TH9_17170 [Thalassospira xiamenensis]|nr:hypothetical protein TH9_17170 [Thalassospira xiamenensis]
MRFTAQKLSISLLFGTTAFLAFAHPNAAWSQNATDINAQNGATSGRDDAIQTRPLVIEGEAVKEAGDSTPPVYAGGQVATGGRAGVLGNKDVMETPFSTTSYTSELIKNQQAQEISDVMDNDPSVVNTSGFGNFANRFTIRGFDLTGDDVSIDGLYGTAPRQSVAVEMFERVEVLKGASAFLNGMAPGSGGLGGSINLVPKRATDDPITSMTGTYGTSSQFGGQVDAGRRFGSDNEFGVRTNLVYRDGEGSIENEERTTQLGAIALDFRGDDARLTFDAGLNKIRVENGRPTVAIGSVTSLPSAPSGSHNFAAEGTFSDLEDKFAQARLEYDVSDSTMLYTAVGAHNSDEAGNYASATLSGSDGSASFGNFANVFERDDVTGTAGVQQTFETGPVKHELNVGTSAMWQEVHQNWSFLTGENGNIYSSGPSGIAFGDPGDPKLSSTSILSSYFLADTLTFLDDKVHLTGGIRRQNVKVRNYTLATGAKSSAYDSSANSPMVSVIGEVTDYLSVYGNYIEGLSQGQTVSDSSATNLGETLAPYKTKQYEIGTKVDFGSFGGGIALFQAEKPSAYLNSSNVFATDGEQRNRGIELTAFGEPVEGIRILGGVTFIDAELVSTENGTNDGNTAPGVPDYQLTFGTEYDLPFLEGATVGARVIHTASQYVNTANTASIPSWTRLDVSARYKTELYNYPVTFQANVENLTDNDYWETASTQTNYITAGAPLTAKFAITANF